MRHRRKNCDQRATTACDVALRPGSSKGHGPASVRHGPPEAILAILRSAQSAAPDARLPEVLDAFRRQWMALGQRRYPSLGDDVEDAVQDALLKLVSSDKLDRLNDATRLEAWARSIFVHTVIDLARDRQRHQKRRVWLGGPEEDSEEALRERLPSHTPTPEEMSRLKERLEIVAETCQRLEVARLRFVEDLPEKDIAARQSLSRDGVAGQLKRIRKGLRTAFDDTD
jgi:RNA polymerase sigma factor (sigma-70 family)